VSPARSFVDTVLIARFELLRALQTWRALALILIYGLVCGGATWSMIRVIIVPLENTLASALGMPSTTRPGAMLGQILGSEQYRNQLLNLFDGNEAAADLWLNTPPTVTFFVIISYVMVPFLGATTAAESIAIDRQNRALRFEAMRTGRLEFVMGRFLGQAFLMTVSVLTAGVIVGVVTVASMTNVNIPLLVTALIDVTPWMIAATLPFLGLGIAVSQIMGSPGPARVLALVSMFASWILLGMSERPRVADSLIWQSVGQLLPQTWSWDLWTAPERAGPAAILVALGVLYAAIGLPIFLRSDL